MSTSYDVAVELAVLDQAGILVPYVPRRQKAKRRLYLGARAVTEISSPTSALAMLGVQGRVRDVLDIWTTGGRVWTDPQGKPRFLKPIFPPKPDVWEMLMIEPGAQVRIFFVFAEPDTIFVSHMRTRAFLGKRNSQNWRDAKAECISAWNKLFPHPPFKGNTIRDYVTENCDAFAI